MAKILHCRDAGFDCNVVIEGDSVEDILAKVKPHAASAHNVQVDAALASQLAPLIKES